MSKATSFIFVAGIPVVTIGVGVGVALTSGLDNAFLSALTAALVYVTAFYAYTSWQTVEASRASVVEMEKQRYLSSQPWVFPRMADDRGEFSAPSSLVFHNVGNGPALCLSPFISDGKVANIGTEWKRRSGPSDSRKTGPSWATLSPGASITWQRAFETPTPGQIGVVGVKYQDIYGREILSGWAYRIEKTENDGLVVVPGEPLYPMSR